MLHAQCMQADALATVLTVLGPNEGMRFADAHGIAALFSVRGAEGLEWRESAAWKKARPD
ncbi:hypothetical protein APY03_6789 [Variovorax sp. WDL1]|nr:hypothetical protein APY03_6789 [Variovorax sp. WDL1]